MERMKLKHLVNAILLGLALLSFKPSINIMHDREEYTVQSFFSGMNIQDKIYGDGNPTSIPTYMSDLVTFNVDSRALKNIGHGEDEVKLSDLYTPYYHNYEYRDFAWLPNDASNEEEQQIGPKNRYDSTTCKIRAYYHDIDLWGMKVTAMYDFTGFLVGESTLMTCAHGLFMDVTSGFMDDATTNRYFPGKIEVYGAIGLNDTWGKDYEYYSTVSDIYMKSAYIRSRTLSNDWAVLRLNKPIGKELSYKVLTPYMENDPHYEMVGYPIFNQSHNKIPVSGFNRSLMNDLLEYNADTLDGMSGSPICNTVSHNNDYAIDTHPYEEYHVAYGMHLARDESTGKGIGIWLNSQMATLIDELNKRYEPEAVNLSIPDRNPLNNIAIPISEDYTVALTSSNATSQNNAVSLGASSRYSAVTLDFNFPISSISMAPYRSTTYYNSVLRMVTTHYDGTTSYRTITPSTSNITMNYTFVRPAKTVSLILEKASANSPDNILISSITINPEWGYMPISPGAPFYDAHEMDAFEMQTTNDNNCVSYAFRRYVNYQGLCGTDNLGEHDHDNHFGWLPGMFSGEIASRDQTNISRLISSFENDCGMLGIDFYKTKKYALLPRGYHKVALMYSSDGYYHFLRENSNGVWSHYFHGSGIYSVDSLGRTIYDPEQATIVSLRNEINVLDNPWGNHIWTSDTFDTLRLVNYFAVEDYLGE